MASEAFPGSRGSHQSTPDACSIPSLVATSGVFTSSGPRLPLLGRDRYASGDCSGSETGMSRMAYSRGLRDEGEVVSPISPHQVVDWPTEMWSSLGEATCYLHRAVARLEDVRNEQARKHVRANRVEAAEDEAFDAERSFVLLQRSLGVESPRPCEKGARAALVEVTVATAGAVMQVGERTPLPQEVWPRVLSYVLPWHLIDEQGRAP